jgi:hypothetical protein
LAKIRRKIKDPAPVVLNELTTSEGSKDAVAFLIDSNKRANKYTSGVISFRDNEKPTARQIQEVMKDFRKTFLPDLMKTEHQFYGYCIEIRNVELHYLTAKQDAKTGKALNIAPRYHKGYLKILKKSKMTKKARL